MSSGLLVLEPGDVLVKAASRGAQDKLILALGYKPTSYYSLVRKMPSGVAYFVLPKVAFDKVAKIKGVSKARFSKRDRWRPVTPLVQREAYERGLGGFKRQPNYLYHVTLEWRMPKIAEHGLDPTAESGMTADTGYEEHAKGHLFLSDAAGVEYWLAMAYAGAGLWAQRGQRMGRKVLLRVPKRKCTKDEHGTRDATNWLGKRSTAYRCTFHVPPGKIQIWDPADKAWRPLADWREVVERPIEGSARPATLSQIKGRLMAY